MGRSPSRGEGQRREYWDACLFLDLLNGTPGRCEILEDMMEDLAGDEAPVLAMTSVVTIAEVAFSVQEKAGARLSSEALARIDGFWAPPPRSPFVLVEVHDAVAREARDLIRLSVAAGRSLKPHDAIHVATARRWNASTLWTWDDRLLKLDGLSGLRIRAPVRSQLPFGAPDADPT